MTGRIGVYVHSDSTTPDKGACMLVVRTQSDFASRTAEVKKFADRAAMFAYGMSYVVEDAVAEHRSYPDTEMPKPWEIIARSFPDIELERLELAATLGETVEITEFSFARV